MPDNNHPIIGAKAPAKVQLEAGKKYFWCRCGRSGNQPFCDGSHRGTSISPLEFTAEHSESAVLCQCKATANAPFCDGSHASLGDLQIGDPAPKAESSSALPDAVPNLSDLTTYDITTWKREMADLSGIRFAGLSD